MASSRWVTLRAQWLGQQLRNLREENGLLLKEVAEYLERDPATLSRYESGIYPIQSAELIKLLDLYRVSDEHRRFTLLKLGDEAWQKGWWDGYTPDLADWFSDYIWLESRADRIQTFDNVVFPGLFQTEEYAEVVLRTADWDLGDESIRRLLELRMTRKAILAKPKPPRISVILDEALLRRPAGTPEVFAAQLRYLVECAGRPSIEIRVLPFKAGFHPSDTGSFKVFTMPEPFPKIAHADTPQGAVYIESPHCDRLVHVYDRLRKLSLNPADSVDLITAVAEELE